MPKQVHTRCIEGCFCATPENYSALYAESKLITESVQKQRAQLLGEDQECKATYKTDL